MAIDFSAISESQMLSIAMHTQNHQLMEEIAHTGNIAIARNDNVTDSALRILYDGLDPQDSNFPIYIRVIISNPNCSDELMMKIINDGHCDGDVWKDIYRNTNSVDLYLLAYQMYDNPDENSHIDLFKRDICPSGIMESAIISGENFYLFTNLGLSVPFILWWFEHLAPQYEELLIKRIFTMSMERGDLSEDDIESIVYHLTSNDLFTDNMAIDIIFHGNITLNEATLEMVYNSTTNKSIVEAIINSENCSYELIERIISEGNKLTG